MDEKSMVLRAFFSFDNDAMLINGNPGTPIINNSDMPIGTVFTFSGGGGATSTNIFEGDRTGRRNFNRARRSGIAYSYPRA
ncbi:MAG: hypothetical protein WA784_12485 [Albidovulum sp.]